MIRLWMLLSTAMLAFGQQRLTIEDAERAALSNHPSIQSTALRAKAAAEVPSEVKSALYPQITGSATAVASIPFSRIAAGALNNPVIYDRVAGGIAVSQLLYDFGRTSSVVKETQLLAQASTQNAEAARLRVLLDVDAAYLTALRALAVLRVAAQTVKARQLVVDQVTALAKSQLKSELDVTFAKVNLSESQLLLSSAQNDVRSAMAQLTTAMGQRGEGAYELSEVGMPDDLVKDLSPLLDEAIRKRPDLASLRSLEQAARQNVESEKLLVKPTFSSVGAVGVIPAHEDALHGRYAAAGMNLSIPVFNGHLFAARRREAEYKAQAATQQVRDSENRIAQAVRVAYLNAQNAFERLELTAQLVATARQAMELAQARYDLGLGSIVELTQAQLNATSAEIASATARYEYQIRRSVLRYEIGSF